MSAGDDALIPVALQRVTEHFDEVHVGKPATAAEIERLERKTGALPRGLRALYRTFSGIRVRTLDEGVDGSLLSAREAARERIPEFPRLVPLAADGCGNYHSVLVGKGPGEGAVVQWEHELGSIETVVASSVPRYFSMWADELCTCVAPDGTRDPHVQHPWMRDERWMNRHDPGWKALLTQPRFLALLEDEERRRRELLGAHDDDDTPASDYPLATEDQLRARALEELLKGVRPAARRAISRRFSKLSSSQLYDLENALTETAKAECLLILLDAAGTGCPAWLAELTRTHGNPLESGQVRAAIQGESQDLLVSLIDHDPAAARKLAKGKATLTRE